MNQHEINLLELQLLEGEVNRLRHALLRITQPYAHPVVPGASRRRMSIKTSLPRGSSVFDCVLS